MATLPPHSPHAPHTSTSIDTSPSKAAPARSAHKRSIKPLPPEVAVYIVGGAVRDQLLGLPVHDRDWVVVGATPTLMAAHGFTPVGKDFPVFLHPQSHEEYALARTERKSGQGYKGFTVYADQAVTIEEDLARRDLTINAMAMRTLADGSQEWIDPYDGHADLARKVLRHVTSAFAEDPLRILRIARFSARFTEFEVAPETMALMQQMVAAGEVEHLVPERVWQEFARGLMEAAPIRMLQVLRASGALAVVLPELDALWQTPASTELSSAAQHNAGEQAMQRLAFAAQRQLGLPIRVAVLTADIGKRQSATAATPAAAPPAEPSNHGKELIHQLADRLKLPSDIRELAVLVAQEHQAILHLLPQPSATAIVQLLERCDAFRRPERFMQVLQACDCIAKGPNSRAGTEHQAEPAIRLLSEALPLAQQIHTADIAKNAAMQGLKGEQIGQAIQQARIDALAGLLRPQASDQA